MRKFRVYFYRYLSILLTFTLLFSSLITPVQIVWGDRTDNLAGFINDVQSLENIEISGEWNNEEDMNKQVQGKGLVQDNLGLISSLLSNTENHQIVANSVYEREDTEILVKFNNTDEADRVKKELKSKLKLSKLNLKKRIKSSNLDVLEIGAADNIKLVLKALEKESSVVYAQPNYRMTYNYMPTDPQFSSQWSLLNNGQEVNGQAGMPGVDIDVVNAWDRTSGNRDIVVGVLDTGIDINHGDLYDNIYVNDNEIAGNGIDDDNNGYIDGYERLEFL